MRDTPWGVKIHIADADIGSKASQKYSNENTKTTVVKIITIYDFLRESLEEVRKRHTHRMG